MATYPYLVEIAWNVVDRFLTDWQAAPYRWSKEIDVQVEIASRLGAALRLIGRDSIRANYDTVVPGFEGNQLWSRVACEPAVPYTWSDGNSYRCYPDIVVWDDIPDPDSPPDARGGAFPILWSCEIKYTSAETSDWDCEKMKTLVKQGLMRYGCWVRMKLERAHQGSGLRWARDAADGRVWTCDASLPPNRAH